MVLVKLLDCTVEASQVRIYPELMKVRCLVGKRPMLGQSSREDRDSHAVSKCAANVFRFDVVLLRRSPFPNSLKSAYVDSVHVPSLP